MAAQSTVLVRFTTKLPPELRVADTEVVRASRGRCAALLPRRADSRRRSS
jgi:hypothetical protein